jgi:hypothetical protein
MGVMVGISVGGMGVSVGVALGVSVGGGRVAVGGAGVAVGGDEGVHPTKTVKAMIVNVRRNLRFISFLLSFYPVIGHSKVFCTVRR